MSTCIRLLRASAVGALILSLAAGAWLGAAAEASARVSPSDFGAGNAVAPKTNPAGPRIQGTDVKNLDTSELFATIQDAIDDPDTDAGDVLEMQVASHAEGLVAVNKSVTIRGMAGGTDILATTDTGSSGDARGWFLVTVPSVHFEDLDLDGQSGVGRSIYQCIRFTAAAAGGTVDGCSFAHVIGLPVGSYDGRGIATQANITVTDCTFSDIRRIGVHVFGSAVTAAVVSGCTYTGKGAGDQLDYGIELGGGAIATLTNNTITSCTGVALVDGSTSAAVLITDYYAPGTAGTLSGNFLNGSTAGIATGYLATDASIVAAHGNDLSGDTYGVVNPSTAKTDDASANWWGSNVPATVASQAGAGVDYTPWLHAGGDTGGGVGFQGDYSTLDVDDDSPQVGAVGRVQEGINLVTASTVNVAAGTYAEKIFVNKSVTLNGAQAGVDARGRTGMPESIISPNAAYCVVVQADDVTIDGFEITSDWATNSDVAGIYVSDSIGQPGEGDTELSGVVIKNTVIHSLTDGLRTGGQGIHGVVVGPKTDGVELAYNDIRDLHSIDDSYSYTPVGIMIWGNPGEEAKNTNVHHNLVHTIENDDATVSPRGMQASVYADNTTISHNEIHGVVRGRGMRLHPYASGVLSVTDNSVHDCGQTGIRVEAPATLTGNTITACPVGVWVKPSSSPFYTDLSVDVNQNNLSGNTNYGIEAIPGTGQNVSVDGSCNWWGALDGPSGVGWGSGDAVSDHVVYWPWLDAPAPGGNCNQFGPNHVAAIADTCISTVHPCETVDVVFTRGDPTPLRGYSVTFQLSPELMLCSAPPATSILEGPYLASAGSPNGTTFLVVDNLGGSYTVDNAVLGGAPSNCGATGTGVVFRIRVKNSGVDGTGTITVTSVTARDCNNVPLPGIPGPPATVDIDNTAPGPIALTAVQDKVSNPATDPTTFINVTVPAVDPTDLVKVYRKGFGNYPEYDDPPGAGSVPALPATEVAALGAGWALAFTVAGPGPTVVAHEPPARDFWYFVAFVKDACGNVGGATSMTSGTLDYHLGDVHNGGTNCVGDSRVNMLDISFLGANYAITLGVSDPLGCLDVGPTTDSFVNGRPLTDNRVQFEDLILFAINAFSVFKTREAPPLAASDEIAVLVPSSLEVGGTFDARLWARGAGRVQGLSVQLAWDPAVVAPLGIEAGELLGSQDGVAFSPGPGGVDAALVGERAVGLAGEGVLATVRFRVVGPGDPQIEIASIDARDARNGRVDMRAAADGSAHAVPRVTALLGNVPNPFNPSTRIAFTLAERGEVELGIYAVGGHRVRSLLRDVRDAGMHEVTWDGRDDAGARVASGVYYAELVTRGTTRTRPLVLVK